ncbi:MAG TPA: ThuA domain-containing protein [Flavitalea sp.]|nr:ThuA domain-containing protein [Flavitalea sp.]
MRNFLLITIAVLASLACTGPKKTDASVKTKIVFIPGKDSHGIGEHEHLGGCILLAKLLNESVTGVNAVVTEQGWPKDTAVLDDADAIVMYSDGGPGHMVMPHMAHINRLMDKGTGLVNLHYAVEIPKGEGGDNFLKWIGGYFETDYSINPFWTAEFDSLPDHPVTNGVKPFGIRDEWYYHMRFVPEGNNLVSILKKLPPDSSLTRPDGPHENNPLVRKAVLEDKQPQTVAWVYTRPDGGRGFGFTGGHVHKNWMEDNFRKLVLNAIVWSAHMEVPQTGIITKTPTEKELIALQKKKAP